MLHLKQLSKDFAGKPLFTQIDWHLKKGERVGLVGENGAGKSTLMRIIAGQVEHTSGELQFAKGATVGYLPQDGIVTKGRQLFAEVMTALSELQAIEKELAFLTARLAEMPHDDPGHEAPGPLRPPSGGVPPQGGLRHGSRGGQCPHRPRFYRQRLAERMRRVFRGMADAHRPGQAAATEAQRAAAGRATNHLDIEARNWLEGYLQSYPYSVILVSHDRFFLDQVCSRITEVWNHTLTDYHCNYSRYLVLREERVSALREAKRRQDEEVQKIEDFISRFRYKADKAALVQSRIKQLEKIERIVLPPERKRIRFRFPDPPKSGRMVVELKGVRKAYGNNVVLDGIDLTIEKEERVALVGHNGAGKST